MSLTLFSALYGQNSYCKLQLNVNFCRTTFEGEAALYTPFRRDLFEKKYTTPPSACPENEYPYPNELEKPIETTGKTGNLLAA